MDIADQLFEVSVFLAKDGFVAILEERTVSAIFSVEINGVPCQESVHEGRDGHACRSQDDMDVIGMKAHAKQGVCVSLRIFPGRFEKSRRSFLWRKILLRSIPRTMM